MRSVLYLVTTLIVMVLAFWAYRENYRTQTALHEMGSVQRQIATLREDLGMMRAEWAFLNRPQRLRELVNLNFDRLKLVPFNSDQFVTVGQVAFPAPQPPEPQPGLPGMNPNDPPIERPAGFPPVRPQVRTP